MGLHTDSLCEQTGLTYDKKSGTFWGRVYSYPVFLQHIPRRNTLIFRLIADAPADHDSEAFKQKLEQYRREQPGVAQLQYQDRCLTCIFSAASRNRETEAASVVMRLTALASDAHMIPCCMSCGTESGWKHYLLDHGGVTVCDACRTHLEQKIAEAQEKKAQERVSVPGIVIGALTGAAVLFLMTVYVLKVRVLSFLLCYAGVVLCFFLMAKLGKKMTVPAAVLGTVLCLAAGLAAPVVHYAGVIAEQNRDTQQKAEQVVEDAQELLEVFDSMSAEEQQYVLQDESINFDRDELEYQSRLGKLVLENQTAKDCLRHFPELISQNIYDVTRQELVKCLLMTLLAVLGSAAVTAPPMLRASAGKHTLQELAV